MHCIIIHFVVLNANYKPTFLTITFRRRPPLSIRSQPPLSCSKCWHLTMAIAQCALECRKVVDRHAQSFFHTRVSQNVVRGSLPKGEFAVERPRPYEGELPRAPQQPQPFAASAHVVHYVYRDTSTKGLRRSLAESDARLHTRGARPCSSSANAVPSQHAPSA